MPTKTEVITEIVNVYDQLTFYKSQCNALQAQLESEGVGYEPTPVEKALILYARKNIAQRLIGGWHFQTYAPKVYYTDENNDKQPLTFDDWFERIRPSNFDDGEIDELLRTGAPFPDLIQTLTKELKDFYHVKCQTEFGGEQ